MMYETVKLGELLELLTDYHANGAYEKLKENVELLDEPDYAIMIRTTNFEQNNFSSSLKYITEHAYNFLAKSKVYPNDIIMNKIANAGSSYFMPDLKMPVSLAMNLFLLRVKEDIVNPTYLYIYLKLNETYVKSFANGSVTKTITKDAVRNLDIKLPKKEVQDEIASIYLAFSNKINLNQQINETLEALSQTLFKSWFVDFDPVIDNALAAGNPIPDMFAERAKQRKGIQKNNSQDDKAIRALFTDSFEYSEEMGWIPKGWKVGKLGDIVERRNERIKAGKETQVLPYVPIDCISSKSLFLSESKSGNDAQSSLIKFYKDDFLFGAMRPYFHKVCIAPFKGITRTTAFVLKPKFSFDYSFSLMQLFQTSTINFATAQSIGSTIPYAKWEGSMSNIPICLPQEDIRVLFNTILKENFESVSKKYFENNYLCKLRDTLLPKLMSGEIRIPDAAALVEDA